MSLRVAVAAPFVQNGTNRLEENEFVVALSLDRDWFSPDQSKRLIDVATQDGLLEPDGNELVAGFDPTEVTIPEAFVPDEDILTERSAFERVLDALVAEGMAKHEAVGAINTLQGELGVTIETAAVIYARREGLDVDDLVPVARSALVPDADGV
ncbi:DUF2240 family protein [Natrialba magadii ATCC 43099]|uniref:DUF2240 family protein n=1 Tax=Natrialba magadii (strain ATCC 43099 / DSM 3394 / CCM 3739 / CIP 104546 / IAM 13178 / JCM 8861 / NBRC 102185 / NCIMB 2190 / MS3) TaxID=547559 RepID=D3SWI6_NATMM|nr:DUF2240 family protein [Natrialba magadii]ADD03778.1 DUF2240 family protein [Natrialba magadii ATCC 43099]ELY33833.1 hypothetical protein C500_01368 [Natrialba magadii ATCC 43099]